jgi:hypothetical protein
MLVLPLSKYKKLLKTIKKYRSVTFRKHLKFLGFLARKYLYLSAVFSEEISISKEWELLANYFRDNEKYSKLA